MSFDSKEGNPYLIGLKPETIKADIMNFKEEVLVDIKELSKKLEEKCRNINQELKNNMNIFNNKISEFNIKLLELSKKIVTDSNTADKLTNLLYFKEKADDLININKYKIEMYVKDTNYRINKIEDLLKESILFPGLIGPYSKFKNFREFIEFVLSQIGALNDFKEKNIIDLGSYKNKIENFLNSTKMRLENIKKEANIFCLENIEKSESKIFREIGFRDEKFNIMKIENEKHFSNLDKNIMIFQNDINNALKENEEKLKKLDMIEILKNKNEENLEEIKKKSNNIENKINK